MPAPSSNGTSLAERLELYRWAVQDPETHATVLKIMFERIRPGHSPTVLREDFAGSCAESVAWIALGKDRRAVAVDLDPETIQWAQRRAHRIIGDRSRQIAFLTADVMDIAPPDVPAADLISVLNFSILYLHDPDSLRAYLSHARRCLATNGLLVLNTFGGSEARQARVDRHYIAPKPRLTTEAAIAPFEYTWEQRSYDPGSARLDCRIHFDMPDPANPENQRRIRDAFQYDWRLWTLPELIRTLGEAGFDQVQVWRHTYDPSRGAAGVFLGEVPAATLEPLPTWTAYLVAIPSGPRAAG